MKSVHANDVRIPAAAREALDRNEEVLVLSHDRPDPGQLPDLKPRGRVPILIAHGSADNDVLTLLPVRGRSFPGTTCGTCCRRA